MFSWWHTLKNCPKLVPCFAEDRNMGRNRNTRKWGYITNIIESLFDKISMSNCFPIFIVRWILNFVDQPTHEIHGNWYITNKIDFTVSHTTDYHVVVCSLFICWQSWSFSYLITMSRQFGLSIFLGGAVICICEWRASTNHLIIS